MPQTKSKLPIVVLAFVNLVLLLASNGIQMLPLISRGSTSSVSGTGGSASTVSGTVLLRLRLHGLISTLLFSSLVRPHHRELWCSDCAWASRC